MSDNLLMLLEMIEEVTWKSSSKFLHLINTGEDKRLHENKGEH